MKFINYVNTEDGKTMSAEEFLENWKKVYPQVVEEVNDDAENIIK
jgi:transposase-like protein